MELNDRVLQDLCASKSAASKLFEALRQGEFNDSQRTTVDEVAGIDGVSRREAIDVLRALEGVGAGEFKVGRKGHPSRLEWSLNPHELAAAANGSGPIPGLSVEPAPTPAPARRERGFALSVVDSQASLILNGNGGKDEDAGAHDDRGHVEQVETPAPAETPAVAETPEAPAVAETPAPRKTRDRPAKTSASSSSSSSSSPSAPASPNTALIEHSHWLRSDVAVRIALPTDLSPREAEILADWIRNLSFER